MKKLIGELHRRSLWQVLGIYLAGSWLALQVVDVVNQNFGLPDWVAPFALILLVIGLPIVLATAFVQEGIGARSAIKDKGSEDEAATQTTKPDADSDGRHGLFTWRNAMTGGVLAFALLGVVAGGYMAMRTLGIGPAASLVAAGVFDERDRVVVAEFESVSGDGALAEAATEALRVDLTQSPIVTVVEPRYVARVLERMERAPDSRLDRQLAMELAIREGIKAVVAGEINAAGRGFVLTAELVAAATGEVLASQRETARDTASVIDAIDQLSRQLRERIGESLKSTRANAPLEQVTTSSLEALRKFSQGVRAIDIERAGPKGVAFLEEAVALDTAFAMAWRKLGTELRNMAEPRSRWVDAMSRAVAHSDRLTERERYLTLGTYYHSVTGDMDRAIRAFESMLELDPTDNYAFGNLAVVYNELRDEVRAEALMSRALEADSFFTFNYTLLMDAQIYQGKTDQATATLASFTRHFPSSPSSLIYSILLSGNRRDYPAVDEGALELADQWPNLYRRAQASRALALSAAASGELEEAEERFKDAEEAEAQRGALPRALNAGLGPVWLDLLVRRETEQAVDRLEEVLQRYPLQNLNAADRPYLELASLLAVAGKPDRAAAMVDEWEELTPEELRNHPSLTRARSRAVGDIASIEGRHSEAIEVFRRSDESGCRLCPLKGLAAAYDAAGERDSAIATYERYIHTPTVARLLWDGFELPSAYERLGQLYDAQGDLENAAKYYAMFVELWAEADEELQPRVRAAQARLEEILRERG